MWFVQKKLVMSTRASPSSSDLLQMTESFRHNGLIRDFKYTC